MWLQTYTGKYFEPFNVELETICIEDIAHALSLICRFGGHCGRFYSVAEHSIAAARYAEEQSGINDPKIALMCLMHDAAEAYLGDVVRSIKERTRIVQEMGNIDSSISFEDFEAELFEFIMEKFEILWEKLFPDHDTRIRAMTIVKEVDDMMLAYEIEYLMQNNDPRITEHQKCLPTTHEEYHFRPLCESHYPLEGCHDHHELGEKMFLERYVALMDKIKPLDSFETLAKDFLESKDGRSAEALGKVFRDTVKNDVFRVMYGGKGTAIEAYDGKRWVDTYQRFPSMADAMMRTPEQREDRHSFRVLVDGEPMYLWDFQSRIWVKYDEAKLHIQEALKVPEDVAALPSEASWSIQRRNPAQTTWHITAERQDKQVCLDYLPDDSESEYRLCLDGEQRYLWNWETMKWVGEGWAIHRRLIGDSLWGKVGRSVSKQEYLGFNPVESNGQHAYRIMKDGETRYCWSWQEKKWMDPKSDLTPTLARLPEVKLTLDPKIKEQLYVTCPTCRGSGIKLKGMLSGPCPTCRVVVTCAMCSIRVILELVNPGKFEGKCDQCQELLKHEAE